MDKSEEKPSQSGQATTGDDDDCYILTLDSSSSEESFTSDKEALKRPSSCVVIDSDSEDESGPEKKKAKIWEVSSEDEALEENLDTGKQPTTVEPQEVIIIDDNGKSKISVKGSKVKEGKSSDKGLILKIKQEVEECPISQYSSPDDGKRGDLDPEAELEISAKTSSGGEAVSEVEQPVKRDGKIKDVYVCRDMPNMPHVSSLPSEPDVSVFPISPEELLKTPRGKKKHPPK